MLFVISSVRNKSNSMIDAFQVLSKNTSIPDGVKLDKIPAANQLMVDLNQEVLNKL